MRVSDIDLDLEVVFDLEVVGVLGKGSRERTLPLGRKTALAHRPPLARSRVAPERRAALAVARPRWPTHPLGIGQMLERRAEQARLPRLYPHQLRHTFAHAWPVQGGGETDLHTIA
jgi:site-specific recombinase XerD